MKGRVLKPGRWYMLLAGDDISRVDAITYRARQALDADGKPGLQEVAAAVLNAYHEERRALVMETHLSVYGLDMPTFLANGDTMFGEAGYAQLRERIEQTHLECSLLVAGFDAHGVGHLCAIGDPGNLQYLDSMGCWAIGSGDSVAVSRLSIRGQAHGTPMLQSAYNVFEAKVAAETALGVGRKTTVFIVSAGQPQRRIDPDVLEKLQPRVRRNLAPPVGRGLIAMLERAVTTQSAPEYPQSPTRDQ